MADPRQRLLRHLRRYPRWYGVAALWLFGMVVLPVVSLDPLELFSSNTPTPPVTGAPATSALGPDGVALPPSGTDGALPPDTAAPTPGTDPFAPGETVPPEIVPPDFIDELFNLIPPPQSLPEIPVELQPIVRALAPMAQQGCTGLGLASLVVAVVAPSAEGVPIERILPYLAPVTSICANFPIPKTHTVCAADQPLIIDLGGLTKTPPILGLGIDQLTAIEDIIALSFGDGFPRLSDTARETLDCALVTE